MKDRIVLLIILFCLLQAPEYRTKTFMIVGQKFNETLPCRCKNVDQCDKSGNCLDKACATGYFGPKCQYRNIICKDHPPEFYSANGEYFDHLPDLIDGSINTYAKIPHVPYDIRLVIYICYKFTRHARLVFHDTGSDLNNMKGVKWVHPSEYITIEKATNVKRFIHGKAVDFEWDPFYISSLSLLIKPNLINMELADVYVSGGRDITHLAEINKITEKGMNCFTPVANSPIHIVLDETISLYAMLMNVTGGTDTDKLGGLSLFNKNKLIVEEFVELSDSTYYCFKEDNNITSGTLNIIGENRMICDFRLLGDYKCEEGRWGLQCENYCYCRNGSCFFLNGVCADFNGSVKRSCNCLKNCNDSGDCGACYDGFYGHRCEKACSFGCTLDTCSKNGNCFGCKPGFFDVNCNRQCSRNCINEVCDSKTGNCNGCKREYYGEKCITRCPKFCLNSVCNDTTGKCLQCMPGSFGHMCEKTCSKNCAANMCNSTDGNCFSCMNGFFGSLCEQRCPKGCNGLVCHRQTSVCLYNCSHGYFGEKCQKCSMNCLHEDCNSVDGSCTACVRGKYGHHCNENCSNSCYMQMCKQDNGTCLSCEKGYFGEFCNHSCSSECKGESCHQTTGDCFGCNTGYYEKNCSGYCPIYCSDNTCIQKNGYCFSCQAGRFGSTCDAVCSQFCEPTICNRMSGICNACDANHFGSRCDQVCSAQCVNNSCFDSNGTCYHCKVGFYGEFCQNSCNKECKDKKCGRDTGICDACIDGYFGDYCQRKCLPPCNIENCRFNNSPCFICPNNNFGRFCDIKCGTFNKKCVDQSCCEKISDPCVCAERNGRSYCTTYESCSHKAQKSVASPYTEAAWATAYVVVGFCVALTVAAFYITGRIKENVEANEPTSLAVSQTTNREPDSVVKTTINEESVRETRENSQADSESSNTEQ